jgi:hypothetical protein
MRPSSATGVIAYVLTLCSAACRSTGTGTAPPAAPPNQCAVVPGPTPPSLTFAIANPVGFSHAPGPRNASEQLVFRQLYETLVTIDCAGAVRPGLATSWSAAEGGRVWLFRLRPGASFWDGTPVTPSAIAASWANNPHALASIVSVTPSDETTLRVDLGQRAVDPQLFAHPQLAVSRNDGSSPWPIGSAPFRPIEASTSALRLSAMDGQRTVEFRIIPDTRRALDTGVDALVSGDAATLEYARALPGYALTPLPWSRTYVLVARAETGDTITPPLDAVAALARDAVRADARPAEPPFWWRNPECAPAQTAASAAPTRGRTIAYPRNDAFARALAERIVALAWPVSRAPAWLSAVLPLTASGQPPTATALDPPAQLDALRNGTALALIAPLPRPAGSACVAGLSTDSVALALAGGPYRIIPLLDARSYLIHRASSGSLLVDGDGTLRIGARTP